jgi:hypothetical protein
MNQVPSNINEMPNEAILEAMHTMEKAVHGHHGVTSGTFLNKSATYAEFGTELLRRGCLSESYFSLNLPDRLAFVPVPSQAKAAQQTGRLITIQINSKNATIEYFDGKVKHVKTWEQTSRSSWGCKEDWGDDPLIPEDVYEVINDIESPVIDAIQMLGMLKD